MSAEPPSQCARIALLHVFDNVVKLRMSMSIKARRTSAYCRGAIKINALQATEARDQRSFPLILSAPIEKLRKITPVTITSTTAATTHYYYYCCVLCFFRSLDHFCKTSLLSPLSCASAALLGALCSQVVFYHWFAYVFVLAGRLVDP